VLAAVAGEVPDRVPYSLWYHFRLNPPAGPALARAELEFAARYRPDLLKVMHDAPYDLPEGLTMVETPDDWRRVPILDARSGWFGAQVETVRMILEGRDEDYPVVATVFGAYATAEKISGRRVVEHLQQDADSVCAGIAALTASICNFVSALMETGLDGIYLAVVGAAADTQTAAQHREYFLSHEQQILDAAAGAPLNVVHHHGVGIYPDNVFPLTGYAIYSWSDRLASNPSIREMRLKTQKCLMCGVDEVTFGERTQAEMLNQAREALASAGKTRFILAPGCAVPTPPACTDDQLRVFEMAATENKEQR
jgi:uroporphyrinogen decarboxylase